MQSLDNLNQMPPICWTIAGSDSGGGAGIQADLKTFQSLGVYGCSILSALTAQNTQAVLLSEAVSTDMLKQQFIALKNDLPPLALKISMIASTSSIDIIADEIRHLNAYKIYDPVMISTSGSLLMPNDLLSNVKTKLLPHIDLLTPNLDEAQKLTGILDNNLPLMAAEILKLGVKSVLIKGGHCDTDTALDYYQNEKTAFWLSSPWVKTPNAHGTGCTLSAAITAAIARGYSLHDALVIGKAYVNQGLRLARETKIGQGNGPLLHAGWPQTQTDIPVVIAESGIVVKEYFPKVIEKSERLGLYVVVPDTNWIEKLVPLNIPVIQLRLKNIEKSEAEKQIQQAIQITQNTTTKLFINDYWDLAIKYQAYGVHLGQSDLDTADLEAIQSAGLRLGISTHCYYEVARTLALKPSYIAVGPVFETTTKQMPFNPQGIDNLQRWVNTLSHYPVIAIGGIFKETNAKAVWDTGVNAVAVVRDITEFQGDLAQHIAEWQTILK